MTTKTAMDVKTKNAVLVGGVLLVLGAFALMSFTNKKSTPPPSDSEDEPNPFPQGRRCPEGEKPCTGNPSKCYNPLANYAVDPCKF